MRTNQTVEQATSRTPHTQRQDVTTGGHRAREQSQFHTNEIWRRSCLRPVNSLSESNRTRLSTGGKSPAFLRGKNPYGAVLDRIEHPYRDTRVVLTGAPSQAGAGPEGRLRTTGAFRFKTSHPSTQDLASDASSSWPQLISSEQRIQHPSVKAAKDILESKRTQSQSVSQAPSPEPVPAVVATPLNGDFIPPSPSLMAHPRLATKLNLNCKDPVEANAPNPRTILRSHLSSITRTETSQRDNPFTRPKTLCPNAESSSCRSNDCVPSGNAHDHSVTSLSPTSRAQLHNQTGTGSDVDTMVIQVPDTAPREDDHWKTSEKTVRLRSEDRYTSVTESEKVTPDGEGQLCWQESERPGPHCDVRVNIKKNRIIRSNSSRQDDSDISLFEKRMPTKRSLDDRALAWTHSVIPGFSSKLDTECYRNNDTNDFYGAEKDATRRVPSGYTSMIESTQSRDDSARVDVLTADVGVQSGYHDIEVPDHVDWRAAYGRRKTQDFGFPGARTKPHKANKDRSPANVSGHLIEHSGSCVSRMKKAKSSVSGFAKTYQSPPAANLPQQPHKYRRRRTWKRAETPSSASNILKSSNAIRQGDHVQQYSNRMPKDTCGEKVAKDLEFMLDDLLQEHSSSLQNVIESLQDSPIGPPQLRQPPEKSEMHTGPAYTTYQPPRTYSEINQLGRPKDRTDTQVQDHFVAWLMEYKWRARFPHVPPTMAEKLNVDNTGQLRPNVNDSYYVLRQSLRTVDDLVDLIDSAADNFGVDLDRQPTASDEQRYQDAPIEGD